MPLFKKVAYAPTIQERALEANKLAADALNLFHNAADDLDVASQLKEEIALDLYKQADSLAAQADEIVGQAVSISLASQDDLRAADRIRDLFAA